MSIYLKYGFLLLLMGSAFSTTAQTSTKQPRSIPAMSLEISSDQTSVLLFPAPIKSVDRGNAGILSKTLKEASNVLKLKAASDSISSTSLHVFTADGEVYTFNVCYHPCPPQLTIDLTEWKRANNGSALVTFQPSKLNEDQVSRYADLIIGLRPIRTFTRSKRKGNAQLAVNGIYYLKGVLYFQLGLVNKSPIPYQHDFTRAYIRDRKKSKRTSLTEKEILPTYSLTQDRSNQAVQHINFVLSFDQFTIADNKHLVFEVFEQNGDRSLSCRMKGKNLLKARTLKPPSPDPSDL